MPAIRFFALLKSGRKIYAKNEAWRAVAQCDAASIALADGKYFEELRKYYLTQAVGREQMEEDARKRALDPTAPTTAMLVKSVFEQAERLN